MFVSFVTTFSYALYIKLFRGKENYDFGLSGNILEVIYRQSVVWIGTVYSPCVIIVSIVTSVVQFYIKKLSLQYSGLPPKRIYNSHTQSIIFLFFLLVSLALMAVPAFFTLGLRPSCGPFGPQQQDKQLNSVYAVLNIWIDQINSTFFKDVFRFLGSLGFVLSLVIFLVIWIYYLYAVEEKRLDKTKKLVKQLNVEREDKKFLIRYYKVQT
jgi:hypothetical protein